MSRAVDFLATHRVGGLPLQPGGRKTSITLAAFCRLREEHKVSTMLVIAPLRVVRQTWPAEVAKWTQFRHLRVSILHGSKKEQALKTDADLYLINPEGVEWLSRQFYGRQLPFDIVCIDELTKFKNASSVRHKALRPRMARTPYRWGLTGTPKPNTHMDLFGQQLILDGGEALGKYITHFRQQYFIKGFNGFDYDLMLGAEKKIAERLAKTWFYMDPVDYSQLPDLVENPIELTMASAEMKAYRQMKNIMLASLPKGGMVTAASAGAAYAKLAQMANGAVYKDDSREVHRIHDLKLDALEELIDTLDGQPLLIGYEFNHDLDRIRERLAPRLPGGVLPYLGKGTTAAQESQWIKEWNQNKLPVMCAHPASAGHGLNLQEGMARHLCWFSVPWDWELYDQFIRRIRRSGNESAQVWNHKLIVKGTIDEVKISDKTEKSNDHHRLMAMLNEEILRDPTQARAAGKAADSGENDMADPLPRPGAGPVSMPAGWGAPAGAPAPQAQQPQYAPQPAQAPAGWGAPAGAPQPAQPQYAPQPAAQPPQGWGPPPSQAPNPGTVHAAPPAQAPAGWGAPPPQPTQEQVQQYYQAPLPDQRQAVEGMITTGQTPAGFDPRVGQMMGQIASGDYGGPVSQIAPAGWGAPPAQPPEGYAGAPAGTAPQRVRGQPSPGKARRTKAEMDEDAAVDAADDAAKKQYPGPLMAQQPAPEPLVLTNPAPADTGWQVPAAQAEVAEYVGDVTSRASAAVQVFYDEAPSRRLRLIEVLVNSKLEFASVQALLGAAESLAAFVEG